MTYNELGRLASTTVTTYDTTGTQLSEVLSVHLFWRTRNRLKSQPTQGSNGWQYARRQT